MLSALNYDVPVCFRVLLILSNAGIIYNWGKCRECSLIDWKQAKGPSHEKHWILPFIPWPPRRRIIKWLASLYSPGTLAEPHYYLHYAQWIGLSFAFVGFLLHMRWQHPFACNLHEIVQPSIQLQLHGSRSLEKQGNWYWNLSVASDIVFPVSPLPLRVKAGRCLGKLNPFEMSTVVLVCPLFLSGWKTGPDGEKERAEGMVEKKRKKVGCPFVFVRRVSRSQWEAIKYLVWAPRSMFH